MSPAAAWNRLIRACDAHVPRLRLAPAGHSSQQAAASRGLRRLLDARTPAKSYAIAWNADVSLLSLSRASGRPLLSAAAPCGSRSAPCTSPAIRRRARRPRPPISACLSNRLTTIFTRSLPYRWRSVAAIRPAFRTVASSWFATIRMVVARLPGRPARRPPSAGTSRHGVPVVRRRELQQRRNPPQVHGADRPLGRGQQVHAGGLALHDEALEERLVEPVRVLHRVGHGEPRLGAQEDRRVAVGQVEVHQQRALVVALPARAPSRRSPRSVVVPTPPLAPMKAKIWPCTLAGRVERHALDGQPRSCAVHRFREPLVDTGAHGLEHQRRVHPRRDDDHAGRRVLPLEQRRQRRRQRVALADVEHARRRAASTVAARAPAGPRPASIAGERPVRARRPRAPIRRADESNSPCQYFSSAHQHSRSQERCFFCQRGAVGIVHGRGDRRRAPAGHPSGWKYMFFKEQRGEVDLSARWRRCDSRRDRTTRTITIRGLALTPCIGL